MYAAAGMYHLVSHNNWSINTVDQYYIKLLNAPSMTQLKYIYQIQPKFSLLAVILMGKFIIPLSLFLLSATTSDITNPTNPAMMDTVPI